MRKRILIPVIVIVVLIGGAAATFAYYSRVTPPPPPPPPAEEPAPEPPTTTPPAKDNDYQKGDVTPPNTEPSPEPPKDEPSTPQPPAPKPPTPPNPVVLPTPTEISRGTTAKKQVIFTFDAGAGTQSLSGILSTLKKHGVKGTFFVTGRWAEVNSSGLRQIATAGHEVFNHTYNHPNLTLESDASIVSQLKKADTIIRPITGKTTLPYFRPPYGARNQHVLDAAWSAKYRSVYWTVDALDWKTDATASLVKSRILNNVSPGTIYLMHIGDTLTAQVLDEVFTTIKARGYSIVPLTNGL